MAKLVITKEDKAEFKNTVNGSSKRLWCLIGCIIDIIATIGVSILIIKFNSFKPVAFYTILYALLVIVVLGGEMIGTYYGALEQYVLNKKTKKVIDFKE